MTDTLIASLSALAGIFLQNCNLLEWLGLVVLLGLGRYLGHDPFQAVGKLWAGKLWYWRYLSVAAVAPVACLTLFIRTGSAPAPAVPDEWSHLFLADTLLSGRFANPPVPQPAAFEAIHILPSPTRSSMYLFGPALWLATGKALFGNGLWGIALAGAFLGIALLWGLDSLFEPQWAWLGTMLFLLKAVCGGIWGMYWIQSYWGGIPGALAGVLVTSAIWRLADLRTNPWICGMILGVGASLLMNTRPFEGIALCAGLLPSAFFLVPRQRLALAAVPVLMIVGGTFALMRTHFEAVTGDPGKLPYVRNQELYGWPMTLPWMPVGNPPPRHEDMKAYWDWERREHETPLLQSAARKFGMNWQHYIGAFLAIPFLLALRRWREVPKLAVLLPLAAVVAAVVIEQTGYPHYLSPASGVIAALVAAGCRMWSGGRAMLLVVGLLIMFGIRTATPAAVTPQAAAGSLCCRYDMGSQRQAVVNRLNAEPGRHLVFVPNTIHVGSSDFYPWVYNEPDLAQAKIVFARDLGSANDKALWKEHFRDRKVWLAAPGIPLKPRPVESENDSQPENRRP